jgi:tetratricopeptide (TPR) repeat protein
LCISRGEYKKSEQHILDGLKESERNNSKIQMLDFLHLQSYLSLQQREYESGYRATVLADEIASEIKIKRANITASRLRGLISLKSNRIESAKETAKKLLSLIEDSGVKNLIRYYHHLNGMIADKECLYSQAVENLEQALSFLPDQYEPLDEHAFFIYPLALAYFRNGEPEKAREQFHRLLDLTLGRLHGGDLYAKSHYWLGKISQKQKKTQDALLHYKKFLQLWKNADSYIPEIEDARKQQAVLTEK